MDFELNWMFEIILLSKLHHHLSLILTRLYQPLRKGHLSCELPGIVTVVLQMNRPSVVGGAARVLNGYVHDLWLSSKEFEDETS